MVQHDRKRAAEMILKNLMTHKRIHPIEYPGHGTYKICYREAGEEIADPDTNLAFEALESGIFKQYERLTIKEGKEDKSYTWMRISDASAKSIDSIFKDMSDQDMEATQVALTFANIRLNEIDKKYADRDKARQLKLEEENTKFNM